MARLLPLSVRVPDCLYIHVALCPLPCPYNGCDVMSHLGRPCPSAGGKALNAKVMRRAQARLWVPSSGRSGLAVGFVGAISPGRPFGGWRRGAQGREGRVSGARQHMGRPAADTAAVDGYQTCGAEKNALTTAAPSLRPWLATRACCGLLGLAILFAYAPRTRVGAPLAGRWAASYDLSTRPGACQQRVAT